MLSLKLNQQKISYFFIGEGQVDGCPVVEVIEDFQLTIEDVDRKEITLIVLQGESVLSLLMTHQLR